MTEEQLVLLVNHVIMMVRSGKLSDKDYNYPLQRFYRYQTQAKVKGAGTEGRMIVEYGALLRFEFIPEGAVRGPTKDIHFKIFKKGTCNINGAVLGYPTLDHPASAGDEGLG